MIPYEYVTESWKLPRIAQEIWDAELVGLDIETTSLQPHEGEIRLVQLNTGKGIYVIDLFQTKTLEPVVNALAESKAIKVLQNGKFEQKWFLYKYGIELWPLFDTYRASAILYNGKFQGKGTHDLYALYARELNVVPQAPDQGLSDWTKPVLDKQQKDYAAEDVEHLFSLRDALKPKLIEAGLGRTALVEFGSILPEAEMELNGFYLDSERWLENVRANAAKEVQLHRELLRELPHPSKQLSLIGFDPDFNLDSSAQLLKSLQMLGMQVDSTNEMTIAMHASEFPIVNKILEYKEYAHARKNFGVDYLKNIFAPTGRVHTNYFPFTGAGRFACLPKTSKVSTDRGILPLGEVRVGDNIQTPKGPRKVINYWNSGRKPTLKFKLEKGIELTCTKDHQVLVDGEWKRAGEISIGSSLYVSQVSGPTTDEIQRIPYTPTTGRKALNFPSELTDRLAFLVGHYTAEGCIGFNKQRPQRPGSKRKPPALPIGSLIPTKVIIALSHEEDDLRDFIFTEWQEHFGAAIGGQYRKFPSPTLTFNSMEMAKWLLALGAGGYAHEKQIPEAIWKSPASVQGAYLRGLFEGDGGSTAGTPQLASASEALLRGVVTLLSAFGVTASIHKQERSDKDVEGSKPIWRLSVLSESRAAYETAIGFWSYRKTDGVMESHPIHSGVDKANLSGVNWKSIYARLKLRYNWHGPDANQKRSYQICFRIKRLTIQGLQWIAPVLDASCPAEEFLINAISWKLRNFRVEEIESVELPEEVCDIEVEDAHSFLVDGIVVHNCSNPNLQQIPRKAAYRRCFRAAPGKKLVIRDYSQVELRLAAEIAGDDALMGVYIRDEDAHAQTASIVSGVPLSEVTKALRQSAKAVNFGFIYGMQAKKFVLYAKSNYGVDLSLRDAYKMRDKYFEGYRGVAAWHNQIFSDNYKRQGMTRTLNGRLRYLPPTAHNEFANSPVQGSGADALKAALRLVYRGLKDKLDGAAKMIHMVHDEIILEVDDNPEVCAEADMILEKGMNEGLQPLLARVPAKSEGKISSDWSEK